MSIMTETEAASVPATVPVHRLTVDRYLKMAKAGVFGEKEPIFLWRGRLAEKKSKGVFHAFAVVSLTHLFVHLIPGGWHSCPGRPVQFGDDGMPEPDLVVVRGANRDYKSRYPTSGDIVLIIEVADSSVAVDSGEVLETYAEESIPIYWIVNIPQRRIEVYREPTGRTDAPTYRHRRFYLPGERVPVVLEGQEVGTVDVSEILP